MKHIRLQKLTGFVVVVEVLIVWFEVEIDWWRFTVFEFFSIFKPAGSWSPNFSGGTQHFKPISHNPSVVNQASQYSANWSITHTPGHISSM